MKQIRKRLTYANVMSSIAVFLVLGGATAFAATKIGSSEIKAKAITTGKIAKEAVTAGKIKSGAVIAGKLGPAAVTSENIADNAVTTAKIADKAVTAQKLNTTGLTVPTAQNATNAQNAVKAENATNAVNAQNAQNAVNAENAVTAQSVLAFARIEDGGSVLPALAKGITSANVTKPAIGVYCFDLPFSPKGGQATVESDSDNDEVITLEVADSPEGFTNCPATAEVEVTHFDVGTPGPEDADFYIELYI